MVELNIAKVLYALALLSMSLNYGIKPIFGIPDNVTWIDPTLILSAFMFCLRPSLKYPYINKLECGFLCHGSIIF